MKDEKDFLKNSADDLLYSLIRFKLSNLNFPDEFIQDVAFLGKGQSHRYQILIRREN